MKDESKLDDLLTQLGTGKWNLLYFFGASYYYMMIPPQIYSSVFLAPNVNHTCVPSIEHNVSYIETDSCSYFRTTPDGLKEEVCQDFIYDDSTFTSTLTSEYGLVCGKAYLRATYQSIYSLCTVGGSLVVGRLGDMYGRKVVMFVSQVLFASFSIGLSFMPDFTVILVFRGLMGAVATATFYMLAIEVCEAKWRSLVGILMALPWSFGMMLWGAMGYLIRDWRWLQFAVSLPNLLILPVTYLIDESPRWLIVTSRHDKAMKVLRRASRINKSTLPPEPALKAIIDDIKAEHENQVKIRENKTGQTTGKNKRCISCLPKLLKTPKMRIICFAIIVIPFLSSLVSSGLSLSGANYSNDPFLYVVLIGLMEVPSYSLPGLIIKRFGRKRPTMIGYVICGVVIFSLAFIPSDISWLVMTFALLGKLTISSSFMILYVYEAELLPTEVRLQGLAMDVFAANMAGTLSPYISDYLSPMVPWLPSVIFGVSAFLANLVLIPLPETLGRALPDTVDDLDRLFRSKKRSNDEEEEGQMEMLTTE